MFSRIFWHNMKHETWICIYKCCWCLRDSHVKEAIGCTVWNIWRILWSDATTTTGDEAGHTTQHLEGKKGSTGTLRTWSGMSCLPLVEDRLGVGVASDLTSKQVTRQSHLVFVQRFWCVSVISCTVSWNDVLIIAAQKWWRLGVLFSDVHGGQTALKKFFK